MPDLMKELLERFFRNGRVILMKFEIAASVTKAYFLHVDQRNTIHNFLRRSAIQTQELK